MEEVLKITNVSKSFGKVKAVNNISFRVKKAKCLLISVLMELVNQQQYQ